MKKYLVAILLTVFVLMLTGCGNSNRAEEFTGTDSQMAEDSDQTEENGDISAEEAEKILREYLVSVNILKSDYVLEPSEPILGKFENEQIFRFEIRYDGGERLLAIYGVTTDGEKIYEYNLADDEWVEQIVENISTESVADYSALDGVTMEVTEYSDTSVTVRITNDTDMNIVCGSDFRLKILDEEIGEWRDMDTVIDDYGFDAVAYEIQKDSPCEMVIDFEWLYGKLEPGRYQIVKTVMDFRGTGDYTNYVYATEFDISMEISEHSVTEASVISQKNISVASVWDRENTAKLSSEDAAVIADFVESGNWMEGTSDCMDDCIIFMDGEEILYDSDCGTFNDTVNEKRLHLTEGQQEEVNAILEKYIVLNAEINAIIEE